MKIKGAINNLNFEEKIKNDSSKNIFRHVSGAVVGSVGSVQFQRVACSSLYLCSRSIGPLQWPVIVNYRTLIGCPCHFQSSSFLFWLPLFASFFSVKFPPWQKGVKVVTYSGSLVQLCCGEGRTLQANITGVCCECSHWVCHSPRWHVLPGSKLLRLPGALQGHCPKWALFCAHFPGLSCSGSRVLREGTDPAGRVFCALPRLEKLRWPPAWRVHRRRWAVHLNHLPGPSCSVPQVPRRALSQVCCVSPLGSWSQAATLLADINHPGSQEDVLATGISSQFGGRCPLWGWECSSPLPYGSGCHTPVSLPLGGEGPTRSQLALLWYLLSPLSRECVRLCVRAFHVKGLFVCLCVFLVTPQSGFLSHVSSLRLSSGHSGPVLTLRTDDAALASLHSPCSMVADVSLWVTSQLAIVVGCIFCGFLFSPSYVALWDSKTPQRPVYERVSCFVESSPSWLPPQDGYPSLNRFSLFVFYILSYLLMKRKGCLSGYLVSSASVQKLFCGSCSTFKWSFDEFMGEKVVSHPIPPPSWYCPLCFHFQKKKISK